MILGGPRHIDDLDSFLRHITHVLARSMSYLIIFTGRLGLINLATACVVVYVESYTLVCREPA